MRKIIFVIFFWYLLKIVLNFFKFCYYIGGKKIKDKNGGKILSLLLWKYVIFFDNEIIFEKFVGLF